MDFAITLLKKKIWSHYTKAVFEDTIQSKSALWCSWMANLQWSLKAITTKFKQHPAMYKKWNLNGAWIKSNSTENIMVNTESFNPMIRKKGYQP